MRPRRFVCTHLSEIYPPMRTPNKEAPAMVMVASGPAVDISIERFCEKSVGNQFLVAHPGKLGTVKYIRMIQNEMLLNNTASPLNRGGFSVVNILSEASAPRA